MRFSLVYKKNNKFKELYSIMKNNIEEASKSFNNNLPKDHNDYYIRVIRPKAEYYDLNGNPINIEVE